MNVEVNELSVWLPGRGVVLGPLSFSVSGLTLLAGRSGVGSSTLLRALGGALPRGALVRGEQISWPRSSARRTRVHLVEGVRSLGDLRARATAVAQPSGQHELLLLDQPLASLPRREHRAAADVIADVARSGAHVLWAEHELSAAVPVAEHVLELPTTPTARLVLEPQAARSWVPRSLPLPPAPALARALGLPDELWWSPDRVAQHPFVKGAVPRGSRAVQGVRTGDGDALLAAPAARTRLPFDLVLKPGECLGVTADLDHLAEAVDVAGRVVALAAGEGAPRRPVRWPLDVPLGRLVRAWRRSTGTHPDAVEQLASRLLVEAAPHLTLRQHSPGERQQLIAALLLASPRPEVLVRPDRGLDPAGRRRLARVLSDGGAARGTCTVLVTDDPELLARACHRVLVIQGTGDERRTVLGPPVLTADHWPVPPALRALGARALRVADVTGDREEEVAP